MIHPVHLRGVGGVGAVSTSQSGSCPLTFLGKSSEGVELGAPSPLGVPEMHRSLSGAGGPATRSLPLPGPAPAEVLRRESSGVPPAQLLLIRCCCCERSCPFLAAGYMPGARQASYSHHNLQRWALLSPHLTHKQTEARGGAGICPRSGRVRVK